MPLKCLSMDWILDTKCVLFCIELKNNVLYKTKENVVALPRCHSHCPLAWAQAHQARCGGAPCPACAGAVRLAALQLLGVKLYSLQSVSSTEMIELQPAITVHNPARSGPRRMQYRRNSMLKHLRYGSIKCRYQYCFECYYWRIIHIVAVGWQKRNVNVEVSSISGWFDRYRSTHLQNWRFFFSGCQYKSIHTLI